MDRNSEVINMNKFYFAFLNCWVQKLTCPPPLKYWPALGPKQPPSRLVTREDKNKAIPIRAWSRVEGSRSFRLPEFLEKRHVNVSRLSVLRPGRLYPQKIILALIYFRGWVEPKAVGRREVLGQRKIPMTPSRVEPANFQLVAQCLIQLLYHIFLFNGYRFSCPWLKWLPSGYEVYLFSPYLPSQRIQRKLYAFSFNQAFLSNSSFTSRSIYLNSGRDMAACLVRVTQYVEKVYIKNK
jgi:hypothetical protein